MRPIDADKLHKFIIEHLPINQLEDPFDGYRDVLSMLEDERVTPTEDVAPVIHAHWVKAERRGCVTYHDSYAECSNCHGEPVQFGRGFKYCPNCGAKMDGKE